MLIPRCSLLEDHHRSLVRCLRLNHRRFLAPNHQCVRLVFHRLHLPRSQVFVLPLFLQDNQHLFRVAGRLLFRQYCHQVSLRRRQLRYHLWSPHRNRPRFRAVCRRRNHPVNLLCNLQAGQVLFQLENQVCCRQHSLLHYHQRNLVLCPALALLLFPLANLQEDQVHSLHCVHQRVRLVYPHLSLVLNQVGGLLQRLRPGQVLNQHCFLLRARLRCLVLNRVLNHQRCPPRNQQLGRQRSRLVSPPLPLRLIPLRSHLACPRRSPLDNQQVCRLVSPLLLPLPSLPACRRLYHRRNQLESQRSNPVESLLRSHLRCQVHFHRRGPAPIRARSRALFPHRSPQAYQPLSHLHSPVCNQPLARALSHRVNLLDGLRLSHLADQVHNPHRVLQRNLSVRRQHSRVRFRVLSRRTVLALSPPHSLQQSPVLNRALFPVHSRLAVRAVVQQRILPADPPVRPPLFRQRNQLQGPQSGQVLNRLVHQALNLRLFRLPHQLRSQVRFRPRCLLASLQHSLLCCHQASLLVVLARSQHRSLRVDHRHGHLLGLPRSPQASLPHNLR